LTHLSESAPIFIGAGQARDFAARDDADFAKRYRTQHTFKTFACSGAQPGAAAKITVDHFDLCPTERTDSFR